MQKLNSCCRWCGPETRREEEEKKDVYYTRVTRIQIQIPAMYPEEWRKRNHHRRSFFGGAEPAEAHHVRHLTVAVDLHRRCTLCELETRPLSLGLLRGLLLFARSQLLISDLGEALVKVECLCLRGLLGLRTKGGYFGANLL